MTPFTCKPYHLTIWPYDRGVATCLKWQKQAKRNPYTGDFNRPMARFPVDRTLCLTCEQGKEIKKKYGRKKA